MLFLKNYKILIITFLIGFSSCYKDHKKETLVEEIGTARFVNTGWHQASVEMAIQNNLMDAYGICYSSKSNLPTTDDSVVYIKNGGATLVHLDNNITYYWRAFINKNDVVSYSEPQTFKTLEKPEIITLNPQNITSNTAILSGEISNTNYTIRGFCFSFIKETPTINDDTIVVVGNDNRPFEGKADLLKEQVYHARAYAVSSLHEVHYGNIVSFRTGNPRPPVVETLDDIDLTTTPVKLWGIITDAGDPNYNCKGICYSNFHTPTIYMDTLQVAGTGLGTFFASKTFTESGVTVYYRAYAITTDTVVYGSIKQFVIP